MKKCLSCGVDFVSDSDWKIYCGSKKLKLGCSFNGKLKKYKKKLWAENNKNKIIKAQKKYLKTEKYRISYLRYSKTQKRKDFKKEYIRTHKEQIKAYAKKIGNKAFGLYKRYWGIKRRCNTKSASGYKYYGGRGIKCEWKSYQDFKKDMYKSYLEHLKKYGKKDTSIDRIDVNGNYCKENCRWATWKEQSRNKR